MDELLRDFLTETGESLDVVDAELVRFERDPNNAEILGHIFRLVHTIKGTCGFIGLPRLAALAHAAESLIGKFRDGAPVTADAVSLILETLDRLKAILAALDKTAREPEGDDTDLIGRLHHAADPGHRRVTASGTVGSLTYQVLERPLQPGEVSLDELERAFRETAGPAPAAPASRPRANASTGTNRSDRSESKVNHQSIRVNLDTLEDLMTMVSELVLTRNQLLEMARRDEDSKFKVPLQRLSSVTAELQESVMKTRMQPIGNAWQKLPRIVRDLAAELGKEIELEMHGADTELDRQVLDQIRDPLTHMVRNSADHGLELPAERRSAGKPEKGTIRLTAYHEGGYIIIEVADDGRGLDTEKIRAKVLEAGLATPAQVEKMTDAQLHRFVFVAGMTTAETVTNISGRGVGMDVVQANIDQLGGSIDVKSVPGEGAAFTIKIPLTLAIISALIIEAAGERFAIPQVALVELVRVKSNSEHRIERIKDTPVLRLRDKLLPLVNLAGFLKLRERSASDFDKGFIVVMKVGSQSFGLVVDAVVHTEEIVVKPLSSKLRQIAVFSGNTILGDGSVIMIVDPNGVAEAIGAAANSLRAAAETKPDTQHETAATTPLLVFRAGSHVPKAVPLGLVTRLEEIDVRKVEVANGRNLVQYRGQLMPLICMDESVRIRSDGSQPLLVFSDGGRSMALVVDEIVDIVDERLDIEIGSDRPGLLGSAVIRGEAAEIVDVAHFLPQAFADWFRYRPADPGTKRSILFVEDSAFFRNMLVPVLRAAGYSVTAVADGREALTRVKNGERFDVIVTDLEMPGMDGIALSEAIRADARMAHTPIIALSAMTSEENVARVREAGIHDFVAKFDRRGLIAALKEQTDHVGRAA
jgi:two-component system chemotaxis sensor kinase CheA